VLLAATTFLLALHLVCVNVAAGGPLVGAWLDWRSRLGDVAAAKAARWLGGWSLGGLLAGAGLGVLVGWLRWDEAYRALWLGPLGYKLHWAVLEAIFSLVLIGLWWWWLPGRPAASRAGLWGRVVISVLAATNLLYHFPPLFTVAAALRDDGAVAGTVLRGAEFRKLMVAGSTPALVVHVALASLAAAGAMLVVLSLKWQRRGESQRAARIAVWGGRWALVPSLGQLPLGLWLLSALTPWQQAQIMGQDAVGTLLFVGALAAAFWLVSDLSQLAMGETRRPLLWRVVGAMGLTVLLMSGLLEAARSARRDAAPATVEHAAPGIAR